MSKISADALDPSAIKAEHQPLNPKSPTPYCAACGTDFWWPCLPYRLAAELQVVERASQNNANAHMDAERRVRELAADLAAAREREQRVEAELRWWESGPTANSDTMTRAVAASRIRAALAGDGAAELERGGELPTKWGSDLEVESGDLDEDDYLAACVREDAGEVAANQPQGEASRVLDGNDGWRA